MAALPSPTQVAGTHSSIYEAYYHQVDPNGTGAIQALDAARFLKKSRLSDVVLSKIWDLSDPTGKGYLDKAGLFVALKLVALAQAGKDINMSNIHSEAPPPKVGELPKVPPPSASPAPLVAPLAAPLSDWSVKPAEREKYSQLFDSLQPSNGLIPGNKVKGVLMESKLPLDTLGKIWDLADQDKDGMLDRHEFIVAMHLVYKALEKHAVPTSLPPELRARPARPPSRPPSRPASRPPSRPPSPSPQPRPPPPRPLQPQTNASLLEGLLDLSSPPSSSPAPAPGGYLTAAERAKFDAQFTAADADRDGFVSGAEIRDVFLDSGLPQATLANIWALCDTESAGKLSREQFACAMWLVQRALRGVPPPAALPPDVLPPPHHHPHTHTHTHPAPPAPPAAPQKIEPVSLGPQPTPEMEAIAREVDALARERLALEAELAAKQREKAVKTSEADSLQSELDTLTATLKQLENQKGEAQKRLNDLKTQVEKLRSQVSAQEAAAAETEAEVAARRAAANSLKERERALNEEASAAEAEAEALNAQLRRTVLLVSQANIKIGHLEEQQRALEAAVEALAAGGAPAAAVLALQPQHSAAHLDRLVRGSTPNDALEDDSFGQSADFSTMNGSSGFSSDPFKDNAFAAPTNDPFAPASGHTQSAEGGFGADPFGAGSDPFAGDSFAPSATPVAADDQGAWESDPFAVLHAPTRASAAAAAGAGSAGSAGGAGAAGGAGGAGGKRHKTPPPRPAPPRPNPPHKTDRKGTLDFTEDPFKDYRYEDPFNIDDPFADVTDSKKADAFGRPTSVAGFETDDFFSNPTVNGSFSKPERISGRVSAPPVAYDPFSGRSKRTNNDSWAAFPNDNWASDDAWAKPDNSSKPSFDAWSKSNTSTKPNFDAWSSNTSKETTNDWKTDNWANKTDNWATDWGSTATDVNKNLNETWPSNTLPSKKEKSPKPVKYAKSLVHTIGGIGRTRQNKEKKNKPTESRSSEFLPSEEQQWAWAAAESKRLEAEAEERRRREDAELQLALAISRQEK